MTLKTAPTWRASCAKRAIDADRYPLSPRVRRLKELLAKIDPAPASAVTPYPAPKPIGFVLAKKRR